MGIPVLTLKIIGSDYRFYGIGIGRAVAAIAENHHDDSGLIWPVGRPIPLARDCARRR